MKKELLKYIKQDNFLKIREIFNKKTGFQYPVLRSKDMKLYNLFICATRYKRLTQTSYRDNKSEKQLYFLGFL